MNMALQPFYLLDVQCSAGQMLAETRRRIAEEKLSMDALDICRADVAALPLSTGSIDAIHAGARLRFSRGAA